MLLHTFVVSHSIVGASLSSAGARVAPFARATHIAALSAIAGSAELIFIATLRIVGAIVGAVGSSSLLLLELA